MAKYKKPNVRRACQAAPAAVYCERRPQFKSGDLIAQSHGDWESWSNVQTLGIRLFTLSTYSHVGVIWVNQATRRVYVIEAVVPELRMVPLSEVGSFYHLPLYADWTGAATFYAKEQVGKPYSKWQAIRAYFGPLPAGSVGQCAALSREILQRAGVDLGTRSTPDALVQRALELHSTLTFVENEKATKPTAYMETATSSR